MMFCKCILQYVEVHVEMHLEVHSNEVICPVKSLKAKKQQIYLKIFVRYH